jgi:peroxiredoxin (alkyl hydroperoxide reductase subunit C)
LKATANGFAWNSCCLSNVLAFNKAVGKFREKNCELIGVSVDSQYTHYAWRETPVEKGGIGKIDFPLVADLNKKISMDYGVLLHDAEISLRGLFIIDKEGIIRHSLVNDLPLGRNVDEAMRILEALQFTEEHGEVCPANWKPGEEAMKPTAEGVAEYLSKHAK